MFFSSTNCTNEYSNTPKTIWSDEAAILLIIEMKTNYKIFSSKGTRRGIIYKKLQDKLAINSVSILFYNA